MAAAVLCLLPWVLVPVQVLRHQHLDIAAIGLALALSLGLPALWLTVAGYLQPGGSAQVSELTLAHVADQLAIAVGAQWEAEARIRRLNDPWPLPISWTAADTTLTDDWDLLERVARSGAGWPRPADPGVWAAGPHELAAGDNELVSVLARVPTGRLVVLGEPGAGKTTLVVRLVLDLLARRQSGEPVPVLVPVASWDPEEDLHKWLSAQVGKGTGLGSLLKAGLILPILDGLDELPAETRQAAIIKINDVLRPGEQLIVTCREEQYRDAVRPADGAEVTLHAAAAIHLRPLDADVVSKYLRAGAGGPNAAARWDPVVAVLGTQAPAGQALTTPLMVGLARFIYDPCPDERARDLPHPAELCEFADRSAVEAHLFDAFIPAAYRQSAGRWTTDETESWLVFLAEHTDGSDLAWWDLPRAVPAATRYPTSNWRVRPTLGVAVRPAVGLGVGLTSGIAAGLIAGLAAGLASGVAVGAAFAVGAGLVASRVAKASAWGTPSGGMGLSIGSILVGIVPGGILAGLMAWLKAGVAAGVAGGLAAGLLFGFLFGLLTVFAMRPVDPRPVFPINFDPPHTNTLAAVILAATAGGIAAAIVVGTAAALGGVSPAVGIAVGIAVGLLLVFGPDDWSPILPVDLPGDLSVAPSPQTVLAVERRTALFFGLSTGVVAGLMAWVVAKVVATFGAPEGVVGLVAGLVAGLMFGLVAGCCFGVITTQTAWPSYMLARGWLAFRHHLPWSLMTFLSDAHQRGVLRQVGAVYQFRHIELQHRLANRDADKGQADSPAAAATEADE